MKSCLHPATSYFICNWYLGWWWGVKANLEVLINHFYYGGHMHPLLVHIGIGTYCYWYIFSACTPYWYILFKISIAWYYQGSHSSLNKYFLWNHFIRWIQQHQLYCTNKMIQSPACLCIEFGHCDKILSLGPCYMTNILTNILRFLSALSFGPIFLL